MNWFIHRMLGHYLQDVEGGDGGNPAGGGDPAPAAASLLAGAAPEQQEFIPEKYQVKKADGTLDLEQSSRKLAESYSHLEKRLGSGDAPPKSVDEYAPKIEAEGFNWEEFKADEGTQSFLKGAHAKGLTNDQVAFVIGEYLNVAPGLMEGNAQLTQEECVAELKTVWPTDTDFKANVQASYRAAQAFASEGNAPGSFDRLMSKYGNDPDFLAFTANIGKELNEDTTVNPGAASNDADFAVQTSELRQQLQDLPPHDPKREVVQQKLDALYQQRYNKPASRINQRSPA